VLVLHGKSLFRSHALLCMCVSLCVCVCGAGFIIGWVLFVFLDLRLFFLGVGEKGRNRRSCRRNERETRSGRFTIASAAASFLSLACPKRTSLQDQTHTDVAIYLRPSWMLLQRWVLVLLHKDKSKAAGVSHAFLSPSLSC
jgi:hypothetical protein